MIHTVPSLRRHRFVRGARDFLLGLGLFTIMMIGANYLPSRTANEQVPIFTSRAYASVQPAAFARQPNVAATSAARASDDLRAKIILGIAFSTLVAGNLALLRHLRRVYASPR
jgi:hypothetical protein